MHRVGAQHLPPGLSVCGSSRRQGPRPVSPRPVAYRRDAGSADRQYGAGIQLGLSCMPGSRGRDLRTGVSKGGGVANGGLSCLEEGSGADLAEGSAQLVDTKFDQIIRTVVAERRQSRSEEHTSELQSHVNLVCRLLL